MAEHQANREGYGYECQYVSLSKNLASLLPRPISKADSLQMNTPTAAVVESPREIAIQSVPGANL